MKTALVLVACSAGVAFAAPTGPSVVAAKGDAAAGVAGATWKTFGPPAIDAERVVFRATMTVGAGGVTSKDDAGVWSSSPGAGLTLVAREGGAAPGTTGKFASFGEPIVRGGAVAFLAKLTNGGGVNGRNNAGIWGDAGGALALVARLGGPAPGVANGTFAKFVSVAQGPDGRPVFVAKLKGAPKGLGVGVFAQNSSGALAPLFVTGFPVTAAGKVKTVAKLDFLPAAKVVGGQTRGVASDGSVVMRATYADKKQGLVAFHHEVLFQDEFQGGLKAAWSVARNDAAFYSFGADEIDLRLNSGDLYQEENSAKNVFVVDTPTSGDFAATLKVTSFAPSQALTFPQIDVLAYDGDDAYARAGYFAFGDGRGFEMGAETDGEFASDVVGRDMGAGTFWLRLLKIGDLYIEMVSTDGDAYDVVAAPIFFGDGTPVKVGFSAMADPTQAVHAHIDSFTVETFLNSVVADGDPVPAAPGSTFKTFGPPLMNGAGHVAFAATLGKAPGVSKANDAGVWRDDGAAGVVQIAREGGAAAGTAGTFASFSDPVARADDAVAFVGKLKGGANATGVWIDEAGTLRLVARQGDAAPGAPAGATFKSFASLVLPDGSGVVFLATLTGTGVTPANDVGIWAEPLGGALTRLIGEGDQFNVGMSGKTIAKLEFLPSVKDVPGQTRGFDGASRLVFRATFTDKTEAIVRFAR